MKHDLKAHLLIGSCLVLSACGKSAEINQKLETVQQCINSPTSIQQSFDLALDESRLPIYVTDENSDQYASAKWYQENESVYESMNWELEDWSTISDLSECDQALETIETEFPKNASVNRMRAFLNFNETIYDKYEVQQVEGAHYGLFDVLTTAQSCLLIDAYPQAFITLRFDADDMYYPAAFSIGWDGDDHSALTTTADGRDLLWRPIATVSQTGCLDAVNALQFSFVERAIEVEDEDLLTWTEYREYTDRFEEISGVVESYNTLVKEQHAALKKLEEAIPPMGPYQPPIIYRDGIEYFSDYDLRGLLKTCQETVPKTFVNGRGETLTSPHSSCNLLTDICNTANIYPPLDAKTCKPYLYK